MRMANDNKSSIIIVAVLLSVSVFLFAGVQLSSLPEVSFSHECAGCSQTFIPADTIVNVKLVSHTDAACIVYFFPSDWNVGAHDTNQVKFFSVSDPNFRKAEILLENLETKQVTIEFRTQATPAIKDFVIDRCGGQTILKYQVGVGMLLPVVTTTTTTTLPMEAQDSPPVEEEITQQIPVQQEVPELPESIPQEPPQVEVTEVEEEPTSRFTTILAMFAFGLVVIVAALVFLIQRGKR